MKTKQIFVQACLTGMLLQALSAFAQGQFIWTTNNGTITITGYIDNPYQAYSVTIPPTITGLPVTAIGYDAFNSHNVYSVQIPDSVTYIGVGAFAFSTLQSITIPDSVTTIDSDAFDECNLTDATIGNGVVNIATLAFENNFYLTNVTIGNSVTALGAGAFENCYNLNGLYFKGNAPVFSPVDWWETFEYDTNLLEVFYLPNTTGWDMGFYGLPTSLYFPDSLLANGNFETGDFGGWNTNGEITITGYSHTGLCAAQIGGRNPGSLNQTFPTQAGQAYVVSFWLRSEFGGSVSWNGNGLGIPTYVSTNWANFQFEVTATGTNAVLAFSTPGASVLQTSMIVDDISVTPAGYGQIKTQLVNGGVQLSFLGLPTTGYALDRTFNLLPPVTWVPQSTNTTSASGMLVLTNAPVTNTNNFWRIRYVP